MRSLLVRATFGERVAGRFVLRSGKRSSEKGFQTTFVGERTEVYKTNMCTAQLEHEFQILCVL